MQNKQPIHIVLASADKSVDRMLIDKLFNSRLADSEDRSIEQRNFVREKYRFIFHEKICSAPVSGRVVFLIFYHLGSELAIREAKKQVDTLRGGWPLSIILLVGVEDPNVDYCGTYKSGWASTYTVKHEMSCFTEGSISSEMSGSVTGTICNLLVLIEDEFRNSTDTNFGNAEADLHYLLCEE